VGALAKAILAPIPGELAKPFIEAYTTKWGLPTDYNGFERVLWYGAWLRQTLRAVSGYLRLPELDGLLVYGLYGDGSAGANRAVSALFKHMGNVSKEIKLYGTVHAPNEVMANALIRRGYKQLGTIEGRNAKVFTVGKM
jgi:hypothetical protein